ncbi:hypothetical protein M758_3G118300 [Ceratodon purpureus]|nr:hypothetical protein M758_3G118300 [Ceratodon purpureus]
MFNFNAPDSPPAPSAAPLNKNARPESSSSYLQAIAKYQLTFFCTTRLTWGFQCVCVCVEGRNYCRLLNSQGTLRSL